MEPITHLMTGACLARAGFNRRAAYATLAMTLAAEFPDIDGLWSFRGPVASLQHHRGITHTFLGLPFEGLVVVGAVWLIHRWRSTRAHPATAHVPTHSPTDETITRPLTAAPIRWGLLYGFTLIALLSHLLLDWTNNYGIRPFFPFNPHWYAGSIVFIFEPVLFALLFASLIAPALFGMIGSEIGARRQPFRGRAWSIATLITILALWGLREVEHDDAIRLASATAYGPTSAPSAELLRITASPFPGNPFRWHTVAETPDFYQIASVDTLHSAVLTDPEQDILPKPPTTLATLAAKRSWLGQAYLDWSTWPVVTDIGATTSDPDTTTAEPPHTVRFHDLRFQYDTAFFAGRRTPPLAGTVLVDPGGRIAEMSMDGRIQK